MCLTFQSPVTSFIDMSFYIHCFINLNAKSFTYSMFECFFCRTFVFVQTLNVLNVLKVKQCMLKTFPALSLIRFVK